MGCESRVLRTGERRGASGDGQEQGTQVGLNGSQQCGKAERTQSKEQRPMSTERVWNQAVGGGGVIVHGYFLDIFLESKGSVFYRWRDASVRMVERDDYLVKVLYWL